MDVSGVKRVVVDRPVDSGQPVRRPGGSGNIGNHQYKNAPVLLLCPGCRRNGGIYG